MMNNLRGSAAMVAAAAAAVCLALLAGASAVTAGAHGAAAGRIAASGGAWGTAREVPGTKPLNLGGHAAIDSVSCAAVGDCSAVGSYASSALDRIPVLEALVVSQTNGTWGTAEEAPGIATLNAGGSAVLDSVSCAAVGECSAGGYYTDSSGNHQALVISETNGTWGTAEEVPGTSALNVGSPGAAIVSVSCSAVGACSAGGYYTGSSGLRQAFVVSEASGTWGTAKEVPGTAALNAGGYAQITAVSCAAAGACSAGGSYASGAIDGIPTTQTFVVSEANGTWGTAKEVPGTAALNAGGYAQVTSISCASAGSCSAGGAYTNSTPATQAFVVRETNGTWATATEVRGIAALNKRRLAMITSVSCASPGNCGAAGFYQDASFNSQAFVVSEAGGTWGTAEEVPGFATLDAASAGGAPTSVSCGAAGDCSAGGYYTDSSGLRQAFVVSEAGGTWGTAEEVPGTAALNAGGYAQITSLSCAAAGDCSAGGSYSSKTRNGVPNGQPFVVSETGGAK